MTLSDLSVLIVERSLVSACDLRSSFVAAGAKIHVVSTFQAAAKLLSTKVIDAALVEYSTDAETVAFVKALSELNIPCIFISEPLPRYVSTRKPPSDTVQAINDLVAAKYQLRSRRLYK